MIKKLFRIFSILSVSLTALFIPSDHSNGCSEGPDPDDVYTIFENSLFDLPLLKPFFLAQSHFFEYDHTSSLGPNTDNLNEWLKYFNNVPTIDDVENIIFPTTQNELESITAYLKTGSGIALQKKFKTNTLVSYLKEKNYEDVMEYLLYAKQCEPQVVQEDPWAEIVRDSTSMKSLIKNGEKKYTQCKDKFLKERYAYQVIRLYHYSGQYQKAIESYNKYFTDNNNSLIKYWSLSHKAGCLRKLDHLDEANYLFGKVFDECPSRRTKCSDSFIMLNDSLFEKTLSFCKNDHEKTVIYLLASYKRGSDVTAVKKIYELEPKSEYLELLLSREISRIEREVLPSKYSYNGQKYYLEPQNNYGMGVEYNKEVFEAVASIAKNNNTLHPFLWDFAAAYIATLNGDEGNVDEFFIQAKRKCPKKDFAYINRIKIAETISKIMRIKKIDPETENEILEKLKWLTQNDNLIPLRAEEAYIYIMYILANKYQAQGDIIKAHLCIGTKKFPASYDDYGNYLGDNNTSPFSYSLYDDYYNQPVIEIHNAMKQGKNSDGSNNLFEFLGYNYTLSEDALIEIEGTKLLSDYKFEEAIGKFKEVSDFSSIYPSSYFGSATLPADPFVIHIKDCHDCDYQAKKDSTYNKLTFAQRMVELKHLADSDKVNADKYYFLLANGYYNMTFYGNNWSAISYSFYDRGGTPNSLFDCSTAMEYYTKAMNVTKDKEFAAKCCFMAAKCEQNKFFRETYGTGELYYQPEDDGKETKQFRNYFNVMIDKYSDTGFFKEALDECKYFNEFVAANN